MYCPQLTTANYSYYGTPSLFSSSTSAGIVVLSGSHQNSLARTNYNPRLKTYQIRCASFAVEPQAPARSCAAVNTVSVEAVVTVELTVGSLLQNLGMLGGAIFLELVSVEIDPKMGLEKDTVGAYLRKVRNNGDESNGDEIKYEGTLVVPCDFGEIGGVFLTNENRKEVFVKDIQLMVGTDDSDLVKVRCNSWLHSKSDSPEKRIFFAKTCLPWQTPNGLLRLRKKELKNIRGNGKGQRKPFENIYDYDTYNDLGCPDQNIAMARPILGSKEHPYPRRCRTGRPTTLKDSLSESRSDHVYVPRDQALSEVRNMTISAKTMNSVLDIIFPSLGTTLVDAMLKFMDIISRDSASKKGMSSPKKLDDLSGSSLSKLVKAIAHGCRRKKHDPRIRDKLAWCRDEEFSRHTLAGLNPCSIQLVTELPLMSKLSPELYGPPESAITEELIEREINGVMSVKEALAQKRLFTLDYHDLLLPYVHKVRELEGTTLYASRSVFFLTEDGTLRPIAIELTRPASSSKPQWRRVFTPSWDAAGAWLWKLAKAHVCAHDSGYHQLISHWLRAHCCTEPYIIAANRQLSAMHPIFKLLRPHFRYTLEVNAVARKTLINAHGLIESCFFPGMYSMELSAAYYDKFWRFDMEALPVDLIRRGMAVEDPTAEHGLRLTIRDYPFAADGLLIWSAIQDWVIAYVHHYYPDSAHVSADDELQSFWTEVRTQGHIDKKDEPWWPVLETPNDLIHILTTIIWTASAHHAAVNFGHYHFSGLIPHRPTIARTTMPVEDEASDVELARFWDSPENALLECFPSPVQATQVMAWMDVLSSHVSDEEYLGSDSGFVEEDLVIRKAYMRFHERLREIERIIDERNRDQSLKNRCGPGIVPYELLKPFSNPGVTGMGIPNSVSI